MPVHGQHSAAPVVDRESIVPSSSGKIQAAIGVIRRAIVVLQRNGSGDAIRCDHRITSHGQTGAGDGNGRCHGRVAVGVQRCRPKVVCDRKGGRTGTGRLQVHDNVRAIQRIRVAAVGEHRRGGGRAYEGVTGKASLNHRNAAGIIDDVVG